MYSDWERRAGAGDEFGPDADGGGRKLGLRDPLPEATTGIITAAVVSPAVPGCLLAQELRAVQRDVAVSACRLCGDSISEFCNGGFEEADPRH